MGKYGDDEKRFKDDEYWSEMSGELFSLEPIFVCLD